MAIKKFTEALKYHDTGLALSLIPELVACSESHPTNSPLVIAAEYSCINILFAFRETPLWCDEALHLAAHTLCLKGDVDSALIVESEIGIIDFEFLGASQIKLSQLFNASSIHGSLYLYHTAKSYSLIYQKRNPNFSSTILHYERHAFFTSVVHCHWHYAQCLIKHSPAIKNQTYSQINQRFNDALVKYNLTLEPIINTIPESLSFLLPFLLNVYFVSSRTSPYDYLSTCLEWQKPYVLEKIK